MPQHLVLDEQGLHEHVVPGVVDDHAAYRLGGLGGHVKGFVAEPRRDLFGIQLGEGHSPIGMLLVVTHDRRRHMGNEHQASTVPGKALDRCDDHGCPLGLFLVTVNVEDGAQLVGDGEGLHLLRDVLHHGSGLGCAGRDEHYFCWIRHDASMMM